MTVVAVMTAVALPQEQLFDASTCPAVGGAAGAVVYALAFGALALGAAVVALGLASARRGSSRGHAFGLSLLGLALPYVALGAWFMPRICHFS